MTEEEVKSGLLNKKVSLDLLNFLLFIEELIEFSNSKSDFDSLVKVL